MQHRHALFPLDITYTLPEDGQAKVDLFLLGVLVLRVLQRGGSVSETKGGTEC